MKKLFLAVATLAATPLAAHAACFGSGNFQTCNDNSGNSYTVNRYGNSTHMNGMSADGDSWSQDSHRFGNTTVTDGIDADGNSWNMQQHSLGGGMNTYSGTDSNGNFFSGTCTQFGCN